MTTNPQDTAAALRAITAERSEAFLERTAVVRALVVALLAGQHSLLLGPPGTAKSELARELTSRVDGARYWEILLSKFTDPKRMFGPVDVAALTRGEYTQVFAGRATQCEIAFIDEIFKMLRRGTERDPGAAQRAAVSPRKRRRPDRLPAHRRGVRL